MLLRSTAVPALLALLAAVPALAEAPRVHPASIVGVVRKGATTSAVGGYSFATSGPVAATIDATCKADDLCDLAASVRGKQIVAVGRIARIGEFTDPKAPLRWVYSHFRGVGGFFDLANDDLGRLFTPGLSDLLVRARRASEILESESAGASPWILSQDWEIPSFTIDATLVGPGRARGIVTYTNLVERPPKPRLLAFDLVRAASGWRIDDILFPRSDDPGAERARMSAMLKVEIADGERQLRHGNTKATAPRR